MTGLDNLPEIPAGEMERERFKFPQYLMFDTIKRGVRRYLCTCCGERFEHDSTSLRMLDTPEDRAWDVIKVNDRAVCPACGCVSLVKNRKTFTPKWYCDAVVYLIPVAEDHVVARCVMYEKYGSGAVGDEAKSDGRKQTFITCGEGSRRSFSGGTVVNFMKKNSGSRFCGRMAFGRKSTDIVRPGSERNPGGWHRIRRF